MKQLLLAIIFILLSASAYAIGNTCITESVVSSGIDDTIILKFSYRFTPDKTITASTVRVHIQSKSGTLQVRTGIQTDSGGNPSGTYLSFLDHTFPGTFWETVDIPDITLSSGTTYHLVTEYLSGTGDINFRNINSPYKIIPRNQYVDNSLAVIRVDTFGNSVTVSGQIPVFFIEDTGGDHFGQPYNLSISTGIHSDGTTGASDDDMVCQYFPGPASTTTVAQVSAYTRLIGSPTSPLEYSIYDVTNYVTVTAGILANPGDLTTSYKWMTATASATIGPASNYKLIFYSDETGTDSSNYYTVNTIQTDATGNDTINYTSYDGIQSYYSMITDTAYDWFDQNHKDLTFQLIPAAPATATFTITPTYTVTPSSTMSPTPSITTTFTPSHTRTPTHTPTSTVTATYTSTPIISSTTTPTFTPSTSPTATSTTTPTITPTSTSSPTVTSTVLIHTSTSTPTIPIVDLAGKKAILFPNPAQSQANVLFNLEEATSIKIEIFNVAGEQVASLQDTYQSGPNQIMPLSFQNIATGIYIAQVWFNEQKVEVIKFAVTAP